MSKSLALIGYASGIAANDPGCRKGPIQLQSNGFAEYLSSKGLESYWETMLIHPTDSKEKPLVIVADLCKQLAESTRTLTEQKRRFVVLGGDHSSAMGTWSGVVAAQCMQENALGLIWIDAHMDSHTFDTTPSGNIHGMPLAALLGYGEVSLTQILTAQPKIRPEHLSLIGIRSFESEEAALLEHLGARIYQMKEIKERGLANILSEAIARAKKDTVGFGISLDLDAIDPKDAPGVGVPEPHGILGEELCRALTVLKQEEQLLGIEVVEYNPYRDKLYKTEKLIQEILLSIFKT